MTLRVLVADDQEIVRTGLAMILDAQDGIEVVARVAHQILSRTQHAFARQLGRFVKMPVGRLQLVVQPVIGETRIAASPDRVAHGAGCASDDLLRRARSRRLLADGAHERIGGMSFEHRSDVLRLETGVTDAGGR